ncbi:MAG: type 4a pilus biogenesis protein PilO [Candidatus Omnitrophica bacterium]|nr:type 4a pilus biogenesis protein PilO [Candidatus Omnitrophota bacterium]
MFIKRLSKREKIIFFAAVSCVSIAILKTLVIAPLNHKINLINRDIKTSAKQLELYMRYLSQKEAIAAEYQKYLGNIKKSASNQEEMAKMLSEIEQLARNSSVYVTDMKPQKTAEKDFYVEYNIEVEIESEVESLINFLHQLNNSPQLLRAKKLRLNLKQKESTLLKSSILITKLLIP